MYELKANKNNIIDTISLDILGRNESIYNFLNFIYSIETSITISLDGEWGTGKTFFVRQVEFIMNLLNKDSNNIENKEINTFINTIKERLISKNINTYGNTRAIYYNACMYDCSEEPIITIIADIIKNNPNLDIESPKIKEGIKEKIDNILSSFTAGVSLQLDNTKALSIEFQKQKNESQPSILDKIIMDKQLENNFKSLLEDLLVEQSNRLVIFVDELDRCNPKFAVKLLERIKYYLNDDRYIFVFSTNINQLQHTIEKFYGYNFDGAYYLQKFFDYQLELPKIDIEHYINAQIMLIPNGSNAYIDETIREIIKFEKFNLRDCNRFFDLLKINYERSRNNSDSRECYFFTAILFVALLAVKIKDINKYQKIKTGEGIDEFRKIVYNCKSISGYLNKIIINKEFIINESVIDKIYNYMFKSNDKNSIMIDGMYIERMYVDKMLDKLSLLAEKKLL